MIYKFRIISDENELFLRIIEISSDNNFYVLHDAIQEACDFSQQQMASFFISNNDWDKLQEFTLMDMNDESIKTIPMENGIIGDYLKEVEDKLIYNFDFFNDRQLFITLMEIKKEVKPDVHYPTCSHSTGNPPLEVLEDENEFNAMFNDLESGDDLDEFDEFEDEIQSEFDEFGDSGEFSDSGSERDY